MKNNKRANETATSVRKDMRIEKELLAKIDAVRGDVPFSAWVKRAIKMRLDSYNIERTCTVESVQEKITVRTGEKKNKKISPNIQRSIETKKILFDAIKKLSIEKKVEIMKARYPKSECRKAIGEIVSKDSIAKYWDEIETALND